MPKSQTKKIEIYSTPTCHFCHLAKNYFDKHNLNYTDYNVAEDESRAKEMIKKSGQMGTPTIVISKGDKEEIIVGFDQARLAKSLGL